MNKLSSVIRSIKNMNFIAIINGAVALETKVLGKGFGEEPFFK
jgi:hypothetical protein